MRTTQLAKVEFQPPIGRTHSWRFSIFIKNRILHTTHTRFYPPGIIRVVVLSIFALETVLSWRDSNSSNDLLRLIYNEARPSESDRLLMNETNVVQTYMLYEVYIVQTGFSRLLLLLRILYEYYVLPVVYLVHCLLYTSPSPRDRQKSRMPSSA